MEENLFINYRRSEDQAAAGRLHDQLERVFGRERIFIDVDGILAGKDFVDELSGRVAECDIFLAVVGKNWADVRDQEGGRRIDNPDDWVRIEIESALGQGKHVIPILVDGAEMPRPEKLPQGLAPFARRNGVRLTHERFRADVEGLVDAIRKLRADARARREADERRRKVERAEVARRAAEDEHRKAEQERRETQEAERAEVERQEAPGRPLPIASKTEVMEGRHQGAPFQSEIRPATDRRPSRKLVGGIVFLALLGIGVAVVRLRPTNLPVSMPPIAIEEAINKGFEANDAKDYAHAMSWWIKAADQDDAVAQYNIGTLYEFAHGVAQDYAQAMSWYQKAAEKRDADAQYRIGLLYEKGNGVAPDYAQAKIWYQKAADQGNAAAKVALKRLGPDKIAK